MNPSLGIGRHNEKTIEIDVEKLLETRLLIQANSGGGKSWAIRRLLEQTAGKVQHIVIDPEGEFSTLREQYDYIIAAPHDGDAVAHPRSAALLARRILELGVSAICDIYDLKAHERQTFVRLFLDALVNAPKKYWRPVIIILDEAHIFAPENGKSESTGAVIDIATRGRKRGLCLVAATQRLSKLHKDVAAELLNKLIGRTGLDIDVRRASDELGMSYREGLHLLRSLQPGGFYCFGPALSTTVTPITIGSVKTTHPKAGNRLLTAPPAPSNKVKKILAKLADLPKEAEKVARTMDDLKKENSLLKRGNELLIKQAGRQDIEVEKRVKQAVSQIVPPKNNNSAGLKAMQDITKVVDNYLFLLSRDSVLIHAGNNPITTDTSIPRDKGINVLIPEGKYLRKGAVRILTELATRYPAGWSKPQVGALTKFSHKGGTFNTYLSDLRKNGYIEERDGLIFATDSGIESLGGNVPETPTTHDAIMGMWRGALRLGAYRILEVIVSGEKEGVNRDAIAIQVDMAKGGGTFNTYLSDLRRNGLAQERNGLFFANDVLYPGS